jgi:hypothetical protein
MTTKTSEFVNIFSEATAAEKLAVYNILKEIDPSSQKLDKLK